jgi:hypothetical protein
MLFQVACVSEDSFLQAWKYSLDAKDVIVSVLMFSQISLSFRTFVPNCLLCGVQFCGDNNSSLVVASYESDLFYWKEGTE